MEKTNERWIQPIANQFLMNPRATIASVAKTMTLEEAPVRECWQAFCRLHEGEHILNLELVDDPNVYRATIRRLDGNGGVVVASEDDPDPMRATWLVCWKSNVDQDDCKLQLTIRNKERLHGVGDGIWSGPV